MTRHRVAHYALFAVAMMIAGLVSSADTVVAATTSGPGVPPTASTTPRTGAELRVFLFSMERDSRPVVAAGQSVSISAGVTVMPESVEAEAAVLRVVLPAGVSLENATPPADRVEAGSTFLWNLGTINAAQLARNVALKVRVGDDVATGAELKLSAEANSTNARMNINNQNAVQYSLFVQNAGAHLVVDSDLATTVLSTEAPATFKVRVMNAGNLPARGAKLTLSLADSVKLRASDPQASSARPGDSNLVTWPLGDIDRGDSRTLTVTVDVERQPIAPPGRQPNPLSFVFDASIPGGGTAPAESHLEVRRTVSRAGHDIALWLSTEGADEPGELMPGRSVFYVLTYANLGNLTAQKTTANLTLSPGLALLEAEPTPAPTAPTPTAGPVSASWDLGDVGAGEARTIRVHVNVVTVAEDGARATAHISAAGHDLNGDNNDAVSLRETARPVPTSTEVSLRPAGAEPSMDTQPHGMSGTFIWWLAAIGSLIAVGAAWLAVRASRARRG